MGGKWKLAYFDTWSDPESALAAYQASLEENLSSDEPTVKGPPEKPRPDFPLQSHASGKWYVYLKGKHHYFVTWNASEGALQEYMDVKDDLMAGRPITKAGGVIVRGLCNRFLASKEKLLNSGWSCLQV